MELNYFIFIGLILRYLYYWSKSTYSMEYFKTKLYKSIVFSIVVAVVFWYIAFSIEVPFRDWWVNAAVAVAYIFVGWGIDSVFLSLMKVYGDKFNKVIEEKGKENV